MLGKIEHIGIAVKDLEAANELYGSLLGVVPYKQENVPSEGVTTSFFKTGDSKVELLMATDPNSPIAK
ncbi:MAG: VOC family protein, partial [Flavobacteriaceae bacterium]|nr:VOC family protein [Flavobacteriaceae bacterium]